MLNVILYHYGDNRQYYFCLCWCSVFDILCFCLFVCSNSTLLFGYLLSRAFFALYCRLESKLTCFFRRFSLSLYRSKEEMFSIGMACFQSYLVKSAFAQCSMPNAPFHRLSPQHKSHFLASHNANIICKQTTTIKNERIFRFSLFYPWEEIKLCIGFNITNDGDLLVYSLGK